MFANSSLTACYVREVRGTCGELSSIHFDQAASCFPVCLCVSLCSYKGYTVVSSQSAMTLHTDQVWLQLRGNLRHKPRSWHNPSCSQPCAYMTRSELKWTVIEQFLTSLLNYNLRLVLPLNLPARCCTRTSNCYSLRENKFCCSAKEPQGLTGNTVVPCNMAKYLV